MTYLDRCDVNIAYKVFVAAKMFVSSDLKIYCILEKRSLSVLEKRSLSVLPHHVICITQINVLVKYKMFKLKIN